MSGEAGGVKPVAGRADAAGAAEAWTEDALLGGRVRFRQPRDGFRSGLEAVLLAASVPAKAGDRVVEAGCGAGAAFLCLGTRVPGVGGVGVERDGFAAELARNNLRTNGLSGWAVAEASLAAFAADMAEGSFDHALANPPWHDPAASASPFPRRDLARRAPDGMLAEWCGALGRVLRHRGSLTLALPAASHAAAAAALDAAGFGGVTLFPLWPKSGRAARLVLVAARKGSRAPGRVLSGLVLHRDTGGFTADAERVLRDGAALALR